MGLGAKNLERGRAVYEGMEVSITVWASSGSTDRPCCDTAYPVVGVVDGHLAKNRSTCRLIQCTFVLALFCGA